MSRCFPYPPPGHTLSKASNEALIESIKLHKEKEKAKSERKKEKKKDKKDRKKVEEEKFQPHLYQKDGSLRKEEAEQLERSSITEEHELPTCSENPSYSSESIQNSNKRKSCSPSLDGTRVQGNILRIRLPSQKHLKCDAQDGGIQLCTTSRRPGSSGSQFVDTRAGSDKFCSTSTAANIHVQSLPPRQLNETNFQDIPISSQENTSSGHCSKRYKKMSEVVQRYNDLIGNWRTPSHSSDEYTDDQEWLFGRNQQDLLREKKENSVDQISCSRSYTLWPRADYLPNSDLYALPFSLPF